MEYNPDMHHRHTIRLDGYDYSSEGLYFVTICTSDKKCLFGKIVDDEMQMNDVGRMVERCWYQIPQHYPNVRLREFIIMPNHLHGILQIVGAEYFPPVCNTQGITRQGKLGSIIKGFKIGVTKQTGCSIWQRNYYEHIIRNARSYEQIAHYIVTNPMRWTSDEMFVE